MERAYLKKYTFIIPIISTIIEIIDKNQAETLYLA